MSQFVVNPNELRRARKKLQGMQLSGRKEVSRLMALAESSFRIAVHPETPAVESIGLLQDAIRCDGANPKYAYHLGRIFFGQQDFDRSAHWFRLACCLAPTSHRIWAHVAVLLRELDGVYRGNDEYEPNVLIGRSKAIMTAIREGEDNIDPELLDFVPPQSLAAEERLARQNQGGPRDAPAGGRDRDNAEMRPAEGVKRYVHARRCRWSGVDHLIVEQVLSGRPTQANVRQLAPILSQLSDRTQRRPETAGAFVVLCLQWLVVGYPVETVRRLMVHLPKRTSSRQLLEDACELFEVEVEEAALRIATAVETGRIPPVLAALIHQRQITWRPLTFRNLGLYRSAREFVAGQHASDEESTAEEQEETTRDFIQRLERAIDSLKGKPQKRLTDEVPKDNSAVTLDADACSELLQNFESAAQQLSQLKDEGFRLLKESLDTSTREIADDAVYQQAVADREAASCFVDTLAESAETTTQRFEQLVEALSALDSSLLGADFGTRREECTGALQGLNNIGKFGKVFKRIDKRLSAAQSQFSTGDAEPAAEWNLLIDGVQAAVPDDTAVDVAQDASASGFAGGLDDWCAEADNFAGGMDADWRLLKDLVARHKTDELTEDNETSLIDLKQRVEQRFEVSDARVVDIGQLRQSGTVTPESLEQLDQAEKHYLQVLQARGRFQKNFRKLPDIKPEPIADQADAEEADTSVDNAQPKASNAKPTVKPAKPPAPPKPRDELTAAELLDYTLHCTDWAVDRMFIDAEQSFDCYPAWVLALPAFQLLRRSIDSERAETVFRMGRRRQARKLWNRMLRTDRLDVGALKNIAVADFIEGDVGRNTSSWREYVEMLYLFDVFEGDPRSRASVRARFHRSFGTAYAPPFLSAKFDNDWADTVNSAALISFLSSSGRVRNFVNHRILEYLNARFEFTSPSLVLGLKRIESEQLTDTALETMKKYADSACQLLPGHAGASFCRLAQKTLDQVAEQCRSASRLTLEETPQYRDEEKQQIELLARMYNLKLKLLVSFNRHVNMVKNIRSFDFLDQLSRLNQIPLEISPGLQPIVAASMGISEEMLMDLDSILTQNVVYSLMKYLFADNEESEREIRIRQCELLVKQVAAKPSLREHLQVVDSGYQFWPEETLNLLSKGPAAQIIDQLRIWHDMYPALGGMARLLANKLCEQKDFEEAKERLERTYAVSRFEPERRQIATMLVALLSQQIQRLLDNEDFEAALEINLQMVRLDDFQPSLVTNLLQIYLNASHRKQARYRTAEVKHAIDDWLQRAGKLAAAPADELDELQRPTEEDLQTVRDAVEEMKAKLKEIGL